MEKQIWSENLTPEQEIIMKILGGFISDIISLFEFLTKDMQPRMAYLCKLGYLETLGKSLKLDEESRNDNSSGVKTEDKTETAGEKEAV